MLNSENKRLSRQMWANRQPTLFRHGCQVFDVEPQEGSTISLSNFMIDPYGADKFCPIL